MSVEFKGCVRWFIYSLDLFKLRYNWANFHHSRMCVTDFREGAFLPNPSPPPPHHLFSWAALKKPILNRVNIRTIKSRHQCSKTVIMGKKKVYLIFRHIQRWYLINSEVAWYIWELKFTHKWLSIQTTFQNIFLLLMPML